MSQSPVPQPPQQEPNHLVLQALSVAPELATMAKETWEAIGIQFNQDAPSPDKKREAREAFLAAYAVLDKLRDLPDWVDDLYEGLVDQLLDWTFFAEQRKS